MKRPSKTAIITGVGIYFLLGSVSLVVTGPFLGALFSFVLGLSLLGWVRARVSRDA